MINNGLCPNLPYDSSETLYLQAGNPRKQILSGIFLFFDAARDAVTVIPDAANADLIAGHAVSARLNMQFGNIQKRNLNIMLAEECLRLRRL